MTKLKFSGKEIAMFKAINPKLAENMDVDGLTDTSFSSISELTVYRVFETRCFEENYKGPAVDSLRRCVVALRDYTCYRHTPEFEALIQLEPDSEAPVKLLGEGYDEALLVARQFAEWLWNSRKISHNWDPVDDVLLLTRVILTRKFEP